MAVTLLVRPTAERWRVTTTAAWLCVSLLSDLRIVLLSLPLKVSAVLLKTRTPGPPRNMCVTVMCRPRLFERWSLCLFMIALQFRGSDLTKVLTPVWWVVLVTLFVAVFGSLQVTPLLTALLNRHILRRIRLTV